jgi:hypothetical protein
MKGSTMAIVELITPAGAANPEPFAAALDAVTHAERFLPQTGAMYRRAVERLVAEPAPDIAALAAKIAVATPGDLDHHFLILADTRRLAGLRNH